MFPVEPGRSQRLVPLSTDLIQDIKAHGNEYQSAANNYREVEGMGDSRIAGRAAASTCHQPIPSDIRRRIAGLAEGPIVVTPTVSMTFLSKSRPRQQKKTPTVKEEKAVASESRMELWVRDAKVQALAQRVRLSFAPDYEGKEKLLKQPSNAMSLQLKDKLTPSMVLTSLKTHLDTLADGVRSLQSWIPILIDLNTQLRNEQFPALDGPKSTVSLCVKTSSDVSFLSCSSDESNTSLELDVPAKKSGKERDNSRELYYGMQMHLVNMLVLPKSRTSLMLNQRKQMTSYLGECSSRFQHEYTDEDWNRDLEAAAFLNGSSIKATRRSKNVRRQ
uniref:Uncharacterized protein LOC108052693 n=1 Tax=Drosophila rhopaloa TaxID=1041015 RepID=A0A6P4FLG2_DRORH